MSYQTLPFFLHFNISSSSSSSSATPLPFPLSSSPISSQVETGMESVDISAAKAALKSSFQLEMAAAKATTQQQQQQQALVDDFWSGNGVVGGDDFVDEFLNFSNEDVAGFLREEREDVEEAEEEEEEEEEEKRWCLTSVSSPGEAQFVESSNSNSSNSDSSVSVIDDFGAQLDVPTDDLENLEWLSHFVEDSFSEFPSSSGSVAALGANSENPKASEKGKCEEASENGSKEEGAAGSGLTVETHVPGKARSKRSRTGNRVWSFHGPHLGESSSTTSSSSSSSSSSYSSSSSSPASCLIFENTGQNQDIFQCLGKPLCKRPKQNKGKKKPLAVSGNGQPQQPPQRRCSHCLVQKTPQWRTGPLGSKTLCNACGVRYKSGRLLPEYRPAGSPTFLSDVHSNNHRKVLEMRREKESTGPAALEPGLPAVHSF